MHVKRNISTSVSDLQMSNMSDSVKRLAIARDGIPVAAPTIQVPNPRDAPLLTVMSNAHDDFNSRYELLREVGKGGFSTVYLCRHRATGLNYAVKVRRRRTLNVIVLCFTNCGFEIIYRLSTFVHSVCVNGLIQFD